MAVASVDKNKKADVQPTATVTSVEDEEESLRIFFHRLTVSEMYLL